MTHRVYVIWTGHRARFRSPHDFPGIRPGEWAFGGGETMGRGLALGVAAELQGRGHKARVVDFQGNECRSRTPTATQLRMFGGAR